MLYLAVQLVILSRAGDNVTFLQSLKVDASLPKLCCLPDEIPGHFMHCIACWINHTRIFARVELFPVLNQYSTNSDANTLATSRYRP